MKKVLFALLVFAVGCKTPCQRISHLLEKHPECAPIDTTTQTVSIETPEVNSEGQAQIFTDSAALDSLRSLLADCGGSTDTIIQQLERLIPYAVRINPVDTSTQEFTLQIAVKNGSILWALNIHPQTHEVEAPLFIQNLTPQGLKADKREIRKLKQEIWFMRIAFFLVTVALVLVILLRK